MSELHYWDTFYAGFVTQKESLLDQLSCLMAYLREKPEEKKNGNGEDKDNLVLKNEAALGSTLFAFSADASFYFLSFSLDCCLLLLWFFYFKTLFGRL